jgi:hypothetical protein
MQASQRIDGGRSIAAVERDKRALRVAREIAVGGSDAAVAATAGIYKYKDTVSVVHEGHVIVLASRQLDDGPWKIGHTVLLPGEGDDAAAAWAHFTELSFPTALRPVGMSVISLDFAKAGGVVPVADVPFWAFSDNAHVYVFRQSEQGTLLVDRFVYDDLLNALVNTWEVRYRRSGKVDVPADRKDTFGSTDMEGDTFIEPTTELSPVAGLENGWFTVVLGPAAVPGSERWQIFAFNKTTQALDSFSFARTSDGLFDLTDANMTSGPKPNVIADCGIKLDGTTFAGPPCAMVYSKQERLKDENDRYQLLKKEARLMLAVPTGADATLAIMDFGIDVHGRLPSIAGTGIPPQVTLPLSAAATIESAIHFESSLGTSAYIDDLTGVPNTFSIELWIAPRMFDGNHHVADGGVEQGVQFTIRLRAGVPTFSVFDMKTEKATVSGPVLEFGFWTHLACTWDGTLAKIYVNGSMYTAPGTSTKPGNQRDLRLGGEWSFSGDLCELRLWKKALDQTKILARMCTTVTSSDPDWADLLGYWRFALPAADPRWKFVNSSAAGAELDGRLDYGCTWVASQAPTARSFAPVAWGSNGLTACTGLLTFAKSKLRPSLMESADARVHLYYCAAADSKQMAAHYSTITSRATYTANWNAGTGTNAQVGLLRFASRYTGSAMNSASTDPFVKIGPGNDSDHAVVTLRSYTGYNEVWPAVPRDLASFCAVINGNAIQPGTHPKPAQPGVVEYDYTKVTVTQAGGQHGPLPGPHVGSSLFAVAPEGTSTNGYAALVQNTDGPAPIARAGIDTWWTSDPPASALQLESGTMVAVFDDQAIAKYTGPLALTRDICVEAWINPTQPSADSALMLFNAGSQRAQYALGLSSGNVYAGNKVMASTSKAASLTSAWTHIAASYRSDFGIQLSGQRYLDVGNDDVLNTGDAVTIEAWVNLAANNVRQTIASKSDQGDIQWELFVDSDGKPVFDVMTIDGTGKKLARVKSSTALDTGKWHHVTGVYDVARENVGAVQTAGNLSAGIGMKSDLMRKLNRMMTVALWIKFSAVGRKSIVSSEYVKNSDVLRFELSLDANDCLNLLVNRDPSVGTVFKTTTALRQGVWTHVCATFDDLNTPTDPTKIYVDGIAVETQRQDGQQITPDNQIYTYVVALGASQRGVVLKDLSIWDRALPMGEAREYIRTPLTGHEPGLVGCWPFADRFGNEAIDIAGVNRAVLFGTDVNFAQIEKGQFVHRLVVDDTVTKNPDPVTNLPVQTEDRMRLGSGALASYLQGTIDAVRLWKVGRMVWEIQYYAKSDVGNASGLVGDWEFETGSGHVAFDSKGQNNATIRDATVKLSDAAVDAMWVPTQYRSGWRIYINGVEADTASVAPQGFGANQCSIGGMTDNSARTRLYAGGINELRVWKNQRTAQQIRENMYRPLSGAEDGLVGYWPCSAGNGPYIADLTGFGAQGTCTQAPTWQTSQAPVADEAPHILDAVGGVAKPTNLTSSSTPVAGEYGELFAEASGALDGVMARAYGAVSGAALNLVRDYGVAELLVQYVGQAQSKPSLIGYIEGAPPLPSENLTVDSPITPYKYLAASAITLTESDDITYAYTASREIGAVVSFEGRIGTHYLGSVSVGFGINTQIADVQLELGVQTKLESNTTWANAASLSTESRSAIEKTIDVFGAWEPNTYSFDPDVKRLYIPNNKGFALVRSETADLYALRSIATGALVQYTMRPNPDIPPDTNIIMFKIDPKYVKNGTLDGYVGFDKDKDYDNLAPGERGSYFKPLEAYALKALIAREQHQLKAYYDQFDAAAVGQGTDIRKESRNLGNLLLNRSGNDALSRDEWKAQIARRSLVNTYVWNSDGGLYAEEEQFGAARDESSSGTWEFVQTAGAYLAVSIGMIGPDGALDLLAGGRIFTKAMKNRRDATSFGINVKLPGEGFLNKRAATPPPGFPEPGQYPVAYEDVACPGKVNQYRFMSFYLAPRKNNFDDFHTIVDQDWLNRQGEYAGSYDPDAFALRQALAYPNLVWRVLHRVTYVNRVPLTPNHVDAETLTPDIHKPDAQSIAMNWLLIEAVPVPVNDPTPQATISADLDDLLATMSNNPLYGTLIASNRAEIKSDAMYFMQGYHEVMSK